MNLFAKKTVASVLGAFTTAITDLEEVRQRELAEAQRKEEEAQLALRAAADARIEAGRAEAVSSRLRALVDTDLAGITSAVAPAALPA